jgi:hypothetical protein
MTEDEIAHLAVEYDAMSGDVGDLIKFARAVESRARLSAIGEWFKEGVRIEREACALVCDIQASVILTNAIEPYQEGRSMGATVCAAAIRARGE